MPDFQDKMAYLSSERNREMWGKHLYVAMCQELPRWTYSQPLLPKLAQCLENKFSQNWGGGDTKKVNRVKGFLAWRNFGKKPWKIAVDPTVQSLQMAKRQNSWEGMNVTAWPL